MNQKQIIINIPSIPEINSESFKKSKNKIKGLLAIILGVSLGISLLWAIGGYRSLQFALNHANLTQNEITRMGFDFDMEGFTPTYEIEWYNNSMKQEYTVHALSGNILEIDWD